MLSGITNYIFGGLFKNETVPQVTTDDSTNSRLILEDDGDWMLVHTTGSDDSMALVPVARNPLMDNSWYITPPACFTAGSTSSLDISPLENLLIEHPSMSVYHHHGLPKPKNGHKKSGEDKSSSSEGNASALQLKSSKKNVILKEPCVSSTKINQVIRHIQNEAQGQKMMQYQQAKFIHLKQLERQNKVQDYQSKPQRQRRKDHSQRPSGRSNDRKCY